MLKNSQNFYKFFNLNQENQPEFRFDYYERLFRKIDSNNDGIIDVININSSLKNLNKITFSNIIQNVRKEKELSNTFNKNYRILSNYSNN